MKRLLQGLLSTVVGVALMAGVAAAQSDQNCQITGTGQGSINTCTNTETKVVTITCNNDTDVIFVNGQSSGSGSATVSGNTNGGSAQSGTAGNINFTYGTDTITCGQAQTASQPGGGQGGGTTTTAAAPTATPASLPNTGSKTLVTVAVVSLAAAALLAGLTRFGVSAYRTSLK